ncbi:GNAT family N-acetyltransferase [Dyella silvatica]|uniref:GNAT family N-acetyltransferase n=1 Tax=Dyella silvatica TaxID=2992128 RepID=UPI00224EFFC2|nr:GNAT family N-acetyltransferase [Dyella silvatica]
MDRLAWQGVTIVQIRHATIEDAAISFAIRREAIRAQCRDDYAAADLDIWTSGDMSETFARRVADQFHVAAVGSHIVGTGMIDLETGRIDAVFVLPEYMRRGVGRAMMDHLQGLAVSAGLGSIQLDSTLNAVSFYRSLGFEGEDRVVYQSSLGVSLTCVSMIKHLPSA